MSGKLRIGFIEPALAVEPRRSVFREFRVLALAAGGIAANASHDRFQIVLLSSSTESLESLTLANTAGIGWPKLLLKFAFEIGFDRNI